MYSNSRNHYSSVRSPFAIQRDSYFGESGDQVHEMIDGQLSHYKVKLHQDASVNQSIAIKNSVSWKRLNCPTNLLKMASRLRALVKSNSSDETAYVGHLKACIQVELKRRQVQATSVLYYPQVATDNYTIKSKTVREKIYSPALDRLCKVKFITVDRRSFTINIMSTDLISYLPSESLTSAINNAIKDNLAEKYDTINTDVNKDVARDDDITCALVSSSGSLIDSRLGSQIDSHDIVLRFNDAPACGIYADDVGCKTTVRIVNSKLLCNETFEISSLSGSVFLTWDPFQYVAPYRMHPVSKSLKTDFPIIETYKRIRSQNPHLPLYMIDPYTIWRLYDELSLTTMRPLPLTPPTSGFIGISLLLNICSHIQVYEYIPSMRVTDICHYYSDTSRADSKSLGCTFGDWHPTATEKLYALAINSGTDEKLIINGTAVLDSCER